MHERYFAFGANLNPATLARRGIRPASARAARLDGYRLVFDVPGIPLVEPVFASVRPDDDHVWGVVYELVPEDMERLRAFEGESYEEVEVDVTSDDGPARARVFRCAEPGRERSPSRRYLESIIAGARHHDLPAEWIARLEAHPSFRLPLVSALWSVVFEVVDRVHRVLVAPASRK